jgi:hypothetical protein
MFGPVASDGPEHLAALAQADATSGCGSTRSRAGLELTVPHEAKNQARKRDES